MSSEKGAEEACSQNMAEYDSYKTNKSAHQNWPEISLEYKLFIILVSIG